MTHDEENGQEKSIRVTNTLKMAVLVRALRNAFAMSQADLAKRGGSSRPTLNRIETMDRRSPRSDTLDNLLQVFRDYGVEITIGDEYLNIHLPRKALIAADELLSATAPRTQE